MSSSGCVKGQMKQKLGVLYLKGQGTLSCKQTALLGSQLQGMEKLPACIASCSTAGVSGAGMGSIYSWNTV